jgi:hypothetical protein
VNYDIDFLGMINFCLRSSDSALSSPSRSKVLNEITNEVFKAILIDFQPLVDDVLAKFPSYREQVQHTPCVLDPEERRQQAQQSAAIKPASTITSSSVQVPVIQTCEMDMTLALEYLTWLQELLLNGQIHDNVLGGIYDRGYKRLLTLLRDMNYRFPIQGSTTTFRPHPQDQNICLSLLDLRLQSQHSKTRELNRLSNIVSRTIIYASKKERLFVADALENYADQFVLEWGGDRESQDCVYLRALALLLRENLARAEAAITFSLENSAINNTTTDPIPNLRLFDSYQNAFHRVVEVCLTEIASSNAHYMPQRDEVVDSFLIWEQGLRRNLTMDLWNMHPQELQGSWQLVEVAGTGSLQDIMTSEQILIEHSAGVGSV